MLVAQILFLFVIGAVWLFLIVHSFLARKMCGQVVMKKRLLGGYEIIVRRSFRNVEMSYRRKYKFELIRVTR